MRQHAGWSGRSQIHLKYLYYFGYESSDSLLEVYGIITKDKQLSDVLKPKQCPNCNEPNKPDSKFCARCRMVLTYDAYNETLEGRKQKDDKIDSLENTVNTMQSTLEKLIVGLSKTRDHQQFNTVVQSLLSSGVLKTASSTD